MNKITIRPWDENNSQAYYRAKEIFIERLGRIQLPFSDVLDMREFRQFQRLASHIDYLVDEINAITKNKLMKLNFEPANKPIPFNEFQININSPQDSYFQIIIQFGDFKSAFQINFNDVLAAPNLDDYIQTAILSYAEFLDEELHYVQNVLFEVNRRPIFIEEFHD